VAALTGYLALCCTVYHTAGFLCAGFRPKPSDPQGTYAQYVAVDEAHLAKLPASVPLETAGGLPLVGLTAWQVGQVHTSGMH
jgi:NADPH:quinone reductase-like Zn-dependent oxidoreductase